MTETAGATETATAQDGNGDAARDTATPDNEAHIFAAIDCDGTATGTRTETASRTAPTTLGTLWPQELSAVSESISSFAGIGMRASSAEWRKFLLVNWARAEVEAASIRREQNDALVQLVANASPPDPEASAGLAAGVKLRICCKCKERPALSKYSWCRECRNAYQRDWQADDRAKSREARKVVKRARLSC